MDTIFWLQDLGTSHFSLYVGQVWVTVHSYFSLLVVLDPVHVVFWPHCTWGVVTLQLHDCRICIGDCNWLDSGVFL